MAEDFTNVVGGKFLFDIDGLKMGLAEARRYLKSADKEFKANTASMDNWAETAEGLEGKIRNLNKHLVFHQQEVAKARQEIEKFHKEGKTSNTEYTRLVDNLNNARAEVGYTEKAIRKYTGMLNNLNNTTEETVKSTEKVTKGYTIMKNVVANLATMLGTRLVGGLKAGVTASVKAFAEYEDAFTGVEKTVDGTAEELAQFDIKLRSMSRSTLPKSASELANIAEVGGQLGVSINDLADFTATMTKLGDSTNLTAEEAGTLIAQIGNITGLKVKDYERMGSTIVALGNSYATTEKDILNFTGRLAGGLKAVGATEQQMVAIATVLSSMGITAEAGGSAVARMFRIMKKAVETGEGLQTFAKTANVSGNEFARIYGKDAVQALILFLEGLNKAEAEGQGTVTILEEVGFKGDEIARVIDALKANTESLPDAINKANTAWEENTALTEEAEKRYDDFSSKMQFAKNNVEQLGQSLGGLLAPVIGDFAGILSTVIDKVLGVKTPADDAAEAMETLTGAIEDYKLASQGIDNNKITDAIKAQSLSTIISAFGIMNTSLNDSREAVKGLNADLELWQKAEPGKELVLNQREWADGLVRATSTIIPTQGEINNKIKEATEGIFNETNNQKLLNKYMDDTARLLADNLDLSSDELLLLGKTEPELARLYSYYEEVNKAKAEEAEWQEHIAKVVSEGTQDAKDYTNAITQSTPDLKEQAMLITQERDSIASLISNIDAFDPDSDEYQRLNAEVEEYNRQLSDVNDKIAEQTALKTEQANSFALGALSSELSIYNQQSRRLTEIHNQMMENYSLIPYADEAHKKELETANELLEAESNRIVLARQRASENLQAYESGTGDAEERLESIRQVIADITSGVLPAVTESTMEALKHQEEILRREALTIGERMAEDIQNAFNQDPSKFQKSFQGFLDSAQMIKDKFAPILDPFKKGMEEVWKLAQPDTEAQKKALDNELKELKKNSEERIKLAEDTEAKQKEALDARLSAGTISNLDYYKQTEAAEKRATEIKRQEQEQQKADEKRIAEEKNAIAQRQFESDKANKIANIWMSYAQAVMQAYGQLGVIGGSIAAATLAVVSGAQTALVAQQQYVPAFAHGGMPENGQLFMANEDGREVMTSYKGRTVVMPLQKHTEWIDELADRLILKVNGGDRMVTNNNNDNHAKTYNINQTIQTQPVSKREVYLQTRRAIKGGI